MATPHKALFTGAASGLGIALALNAAGMRISLKERSADAAKSAARARDASDATAVVPKVEVAANGNFQAVINAMAARRNNLHGIFLERQRLGKQTADFGKRGIFMR